MMAALRFRSTIDRFIVGALLILFWQTLSTVAGEYWVPSPLQTVKAIYSFTLSGRFTPNALYTLQEACIGFVLGGVPGLLLPFWLRRSPTLTAIMEPFMVAAYGLPKLALTPLFIIWFGIGMGSKIAVVCSVTFFIMFFNTLEGVRALELKLVRMAQILGANERQIVMKIILPSSVPYIFAGVKTSIPYAIGGAIIAELVSSNQGLGFLLQYFAMDFDTKNVFATIAVITCIVMAFMFSANWLERRLFAWRPTDGYASGAI